MPRPKLTLTVDGREFETWTSVAIRNTITAGSGSIAIGVGRGSGRQIFSGQTVKAEIGGKTVLDGYMDGESGQHDGRSVGITHKGRDSIAQLIDCSAVHDSGEWEGRTVLQIASDLAKPFGIKISANVLSGDPLPKFKLEESETVFAAILRAATLRGLLPVADGKRGLVLTQAGSKRTTDSLELGVNILTASWEPSDVDRFSQYVVKGQNIGSDEVDPQETVGSVGRARDKGIKLYRPLTIISSEPGDAAAFQALAEWEAASRAGKSRPITITVRGWLQSDGSLWRPNRIAYCRDDLADIDNDMLIDSVVFRGAKPKGATTELGLVLPAAYKPEPPKIENSDAGDIWQ